MGGGEEGIHKALVFHLWGFQIVHSSGQMMGGLCLDARELDIVARLHFLRLPTNFRPLWRTITTNKCATPASSQHSACT